VSARRTTAADPVAGATSVQGHLKRVEDQLGTQMVGHRPADDPPGEQVLHVRVLDVREVQEPSQVET
jgi:hypothetical protein